MKNGDAITGLLATMQAGLAEVETVVYYARPIPDETDQLLHTVFTRFLQLSGAERERFLHGLSGAERALCGIFAHRAATQAVRTGDPALLQRGLLGAAAANVTIPPRRNVEMSLAVFHHCARQLELDPALLFAEVAAFATAPFSGQLAAFGRRTDVVLSRFGWREIQTPDGVQYTFDFR